MTIESFITSYLYKCTLYNGRDVSSNSQMLKYEKRPMLSLHIIGVFTCIQ